MVGDPRSIAVVADDADVSTLCNWQSSDVMVKCDIAKLDTGVENQHANHTQQGGKFYLYLSSYHSQIHSFNAGSLPTATTPISIDINKQFSMLKTIFITFFKSGVNYTGGNANKFKQVNTWHHPFCVDDNVFTYDNDNKLAFSLLLGSTRIPIFPMRNSCETFNHLRKVLGIQNSSHHHININPAEYLSNKFVLAVDFEKNEPRRKVFQWLFNKARGTFNINDERSN